MGNLVAHPLTPDRWDDLVEVFGGGEGRGDCGRCWCMWWRLPRAAVGGNAGRGNKALFAARVQAGPPPGLVGYDGDGLPVGWVQVGPRADVPVWNDPGRLTAPLEAGDAADPQVWGISCFVVRAGHRRKGYFAGLLDAAIGWAKSNGARALDACPVETQDKRPAPSLYHGIAAPFRARGFAEIGRRRPDRPLLRLRLEDRRTAR